MMFVILFVIIKFIYDEHLLVKFYDSNFYSFLLAFYESFDYIYARPPARSQGIIINDYNIYLILVPLVLSIYYNHSWLFKCSDSNFETIQFSLFLNLRFNLPNLLPDLLVNLGRFAWGEGRGVAWAVSVSLLHRQITFVFLFLKFRFSLR